MHTSIPASVPSQVRRQGRLRPVLLHARRHSVGVVLVVFLLACLGLSLFAGALGVGDPLSMDPTKVLAAPSWHLPMGTDNLGRNIFARVLYGMKITMLLSMASIAVAALIGTILGLVAGYRRGWGDAVIMRTMDVLFCFPAILLAILIAAVIGPGLRGAIIAIIVATVPGFTRVLRAATLSQSERDYVTAAIVCGARRGRILVRHLLPNVLPNLLVQVTYGLSMAMLLEGGLSFLGVGVQPPMASLGSILRDGSLYVVVSPWGVLFPGVMLSLIILATNLLGDELHAAIDPRLKRRG